MFFSLALIFIFISQNTQSSPRKLHDVTKEKATRPQTKDQELVQSVQSKDSGSMVIENIEIIFSLDQRIFEPISFHLNPHQYFYLTISDCDRDTFRCCHKAVCETDKATSQEDSNSACACTGVPCTFAIAYINHCGKCTWIAHVH